MVNKSSSSCCSSSSSNMKESVSKSMNCHSSSSTISQLWLQILLLFIYVTSLCCSSTTTKNELSYSAHCNSIVPESTPTIQDDTTFSFPRYPTAYCSGGKPFLSQNSSTASLKYLSFRTRKVYKTNIDGVLKVEASLILRNTPNRYYFGYDNYSFDGQSQASRAVSSRSRFGVLRFGLNGFWSEASGKVCMVGFGTTYSRQGDLLNLGAVFKLDYVKNSSIITSLGSGTLESLSLVHDSDYFNPISILMFTGMNYEYSLIMREIENGGFNGSDFSPSLPLRSQPRRSLCSIFGSFNQFVLTYPSTCDSAKNCTPFGGSIGYLPHGMALNLIECSEENQRLRVLVKFFKDSYGGGYYTSFDPNTTLTGEGFWDGKKNQLLIVACKILNATGSLENVHVGDCSTRLSLRFPATWSITDSSNMAGKIWSSKPTNDSDYFDKIVYKTTQNRAIQVRGLKYEYTQIDRVRKLCSPAKKSKKKKERYPNGDSYDMSFEMSIRSSEGGFSWGYASPLSVGDHFYEQNGYVMYAMAPSSSIPMVYEIGKNSSLESPVNISYKISFSVSSGVGFGGGNSTFNLYSNQTMRVKISAEGIYDAETGGLCMVGCKKIVSKGQLPMKDSLDCEVLVKFQFPSLNSRNNGGGYIKGSIESTRKKSDPLYFEQLHLTSTVYIASVANDNIWRMDFEIILVLISNTLACVFVALQLFYVKKHPETLPFASLLTLAVLTLSYMIPLLLNFEALFLQSRDRQNVSLETGKWIEVNEVLVRVVTMVAFLLQFRLLQLTWSSRLGDGGNQKKDLWASEKKASLYVFLPLYVAGALITWLVHWQKKNNNHGVVLSPLSSHSISYQLWGDLKSYAGLVLDGFLLPQIFLNMFGNTREKALSISYYIGTTLVRLLPHAYDLYRAHRDENDGRFGRSYIYANHGADFYSATWDVIIPCVALVFAAIIFLQQRFGGRCILPRRFRKVEEYEKVPVVSNE